jgi:hypothetical protein
VCVCAGVGKGEEDYFSWNLTSGTVNHNLMMMMGFELRASHLLSKLLIT